MNILLLSFIQILAQCSPALRCQLPVVCGAKLADRNMLLYVMALRANFMPLERIHDMFRELYGGFYLNRHETFLRDACSRRASIAGHFESKGVDRFGSFEESYFSHVPSLEFIRRLYLCEIERHKVTMLAYICSLVGDVLRSDHTFYGTKHVRDGLSHTRLYNAIFGIMNEHGQVLLKVKLVFFLNVAFT